MLLCLTLLSVRRNATATLVSYYSRATNSMIASSDDSLRYRLLIIELRIGAQALKYLSKDLRQ
jgi:hypothetical protein